jgi:hypothetical protein
MDQFQKARQDNAYELSQALAQQVEQAENEVNQQSALRELERQQKIAQNLGNA